MNAFEPIKTVFIRWWKQILIFIIVMAVLVLTEKLALWHAFLFSILGGIWLAALDSRR